MSDQRNLVFQFIVRFKAENDGVSPSMREIEEACGLSSLSHVNYYLQRLVRMKKIEIRYGARNIRVVGAEWAAPVMAEL
jgi:SOS-response transcriptional repressor LexA